MFCVDIVENATEHDVARATISAARLGAGWAWWRKANLDVLVTAFRQESAIGESYDDERKFRIEPVTSLQTDTETALTISTSEITSETISDNTREGVVIELRSMSNVGSYPETLPPFAKRDKNGKLRYSRAKAAVAARAAAKAGGVVSPIVEAPKAEPVNSVASSEREMVLGSTDRRPLPKTTIDELARLEASFRDDRSPITLDMAFGKPTGTPLYRPDAPPERRNVELHTAQLLGDPIPGRSALDRLLKGDAP